MTNAQKWVAAFLVLFIVLFGLSRIINTDEEDIDNLDSYTENDQYSSKEITSIMEELGCYKCHGESFEGTSLAPSLVGVGKYWNRSELINYFRNPSSYRGDERFDEYKKTYSMEMTSFNEVDLKTLGKIADYILEMK